MKTSFWKRWFTWFLTGYRPRCRTCGKLMEVGTLNDRGCTQFYCVDNDDPLHQRLGDTYRRWLAKLEILQAEIEQEDASLPSNYDRRKYGKPKVEIRRVG